MTKATIGGVEYEIAPYALGDFELAAPYLDQMQAQAREFGAADPSAIVAASKPSQMLSVASPCVGFLLPGMRKLLGEGLTLEQLKAKVTIPESMQLPIVVNQLCRESGLTSGEVAPVSPVQ